MVRNQVDFAIEKLPPHMQNLNRSMPIKRLFNFNRIPKIRTRLWNVMCKGRDQEVDRFALCWCLMTFYVCILARKALQILVSDAQSAIAVKHAQKLVSWPALLNNFLCSFSCLLLQLLFSPPGEKSPENIRRSRLRNERILFEVKLSDSFCSFDRMEMRKTYNQWTIQWLESASRSECNKRWCWKKHVDACAFFVPLFWAWFEIIKIYMRIVEKLTKDVFGWWEVSSFVEIQKQFLLSTLKIRWAKFLYLLWCR